MIFAEHVCSDTNLGLLTLLFSSVYSAYFRCVQLITQHRIDNNAIIHVKHHLLPCFIDNTVLGGHLNGCRRGDLLAPPPLPDGRNVPRGIVAGEEG